MQEPKRIFPPETAGTGREGPRFQEKTMNRKTKTLLVVVPILAGALALVGWGGCCHRGGTSDPAKVKERVTARVDDALEDLEATPQQKAQVMALKDRLLTDGLALRAGQKDASSALLALWDEDKPDPAKVHALIDARIDALRRFAHESADAGLELHAMLAPAQRAKVSKKLHRWAAMR
jgi:Spy/CpxP family protein refolding chaperone